MSHTTLNSVILPNGETITYREREGGNEVVLLIHGNMTSSKHWDILMDVLPSQYKLYAVDMRGFGGSSYYKPIESIKDFSDDIKCFVDAIGLKKFSVIGWSTGGTVAMRYAIDYFSDINKIILLCSGSTRGYPFVSVNEKGEYIRLTTLEEIKKDATKAIPVSQAYEQRNKDFLKAVWNSLIYTTNQPNDQKYDEYLEDMLTQRNLTEVYHALNIFNISNVHNGIVEGTGEAKNITHPILILAGENDLVITKQMTEEITEDLNEHALVTYLKGCGHSPLIDDLDQLTLAITDFLQK
ncbi:intracellular short-chain-length polyhydroxyalkanoate depolymerase [Alkalihalobacterium elongatum]|uniref:intracellular short-chain-length polyhydroxyalkanoate depolymerase n=1 Tax=Alkalihalobacterium elongatum TaxID=2675466 RepID=UPI001C1FFCDF|nr:alpha/beta hydrolase [Alkalihalobacterium elongatum]